MDREYIIIGIVVYWILRLNSIYLLYVFYVCIFVFFIDNKFFFCYILCFIKIGCIFCVKIVFINYIFIEDDYNYYCLFFYVIVKVMFLLRNEVF